MRPEPTVWCRLESFVMSFDMSGLTLQSPFIGSHSPDLDLGAALVIEDIFGFSQKTSKDSHVLKIIEIRSQDHLIYVTPAHCAVLHGWPLKSKSRHHTSASRRRWRTDLQWKQREWPEMPGPAACQPQDWACTSSRCSREVGSPLGTSRRPATFDSNIFWSADF